MFAETEIVKYSYNMLTQSSNLRCVVNNEGSGYSSGSGWQLIHAIRPAQPRDAIETIIYKALK